MGRILSYLATLTVLFLICLFSYFNTLKAPFQFDDTEYIKENPYIIGLVERKDYSSFFWQFPISNINNRPFLNYTYTLNYYLGKDQTFGYHLANLWIHFATCLLVFLILRSLLSFSRLKRIETSQASLNLPLVAALIFAAHPVQTQAVTYIMSRSASLCTFLYLASFYCFLLGMTTGKWSHSPLPAERKLFIFGALASSLLLMRVALGVKLIAASLPLAMLVCFFLFFVQWKDLVEFTRTNKRVVALISVSISALVFYKLFVSPLDFFLNESAIYGRSTYLLSQVKWFVFYYLKIWLFPVNLNIDPDVRPVSSLASPGLILALFALVVIAIFAKNQSRTAIFGFLWIPLALAPESSLAPLLDLVVEHRLYLPGFGFATVVAAIFAARKWAPFIILLTVCLAANVVHRNGDWISEKKLWGDATIKSPNKSRVFSNYARALAMRGEDELARVNFQKAIELNPHFFETHHNLGNIYINMGNCDKGIEEHKIALSLKPGLVESMASLANCYKSKEDYNQAIAYYKQALEVNPSLDFIYMELGLIYYFNLNDKETGKFFFRQTLKLNPNNVNRRAMENLLKN